MRPDQAELAVRNARQISKPRLLAGLRALQRADERLKSGEKDARAIMEFLITELAAPTSRSAIT
jgi:DNA polymerase III delta subunit